MKQVKSTSEYSPQLINLPTFLEFSSSTSYSTMFLFDFIAKGSELVTEVPVASEPSSTPPPAVVGSEVDKEVVTYEVIRTVKTINSTTGEVIDTCVYLL